MKTIDRADQGTGMVKLFMPYSAFVPCDSFSVGFFTHQEIIVAKALGLGSDVNINPSGGPLSGNPIMTAGLARIGESFRQIQAGNGRRGIAHATSGPCLQQNLVCVLEGE